MNIPTTINKLLLLVNLVIMFFLCTAQTDSVVYENLDSKLILYPDSTFVLENTGVDIFRVQGFGDNIITYGKYVKYKNKSFYLYSHPEIMSSQLDVIANFEAKDNDSILTIILSSPLSKQKEEYSILEKSYFYTVSFSYVEDKENLQTLPLIFFSDTILIKNFPNKPIEKIGIRIYPYQPMVLRSPFYDYLSLTYSLKDIHSNYLSLYVPKLTACYMYYKRFYGQEIEILDSCTVSIDKNTLLSKCKGKKFNKEWQFIIFQRKNPYGTDKWGNIEDDY